MLGSPHVALFKTDNAVYPIHYGLTNARLVASLVDLPAKELIFIFNATGDGQLSVELPRKTIDSTRDNKDKPYLVFVGHAETGLKRAKAAETQNNNETRTLVINFTKGENEIGVVGTYFIENNSTSTTWNPFGAFTPLQQYKKGFDAQDIVCKEGLQLIIKSSNDHPACVKHETLRKLVGRGWGNTENWIKLANFNDAIKYEIDGGKIVSVSAYSAYTNPSQPGETKSTMLVIMLDAKEKGRLSITMPRDLIDAKIPTNDDSFLLMLNQTDTQYSETKTSFDRTLTFSFPVGTDKIEIIGYGYYNDKLPQLK